MYTTALILEYRDLIYDEIKRLLDEIDLGFMANMVMKYKNDKTVGLYFNKSVVMLDNDAKIYHELLEEPAHTQNLRYGRNGKIVAVIGPEDPTGIHKSAEWLVRQIILWGPNRSGMMFFKSKHS